MTDELAEARALLLAAREARGRLKAMGDPDGFDLYWRKLLALHGDVLPENLRFFARAAWRAGAQWERDHA